MKMLPLALLRGVLVGCTGYSGHTDKQFVGRITGGWVAARGRVDGKNRVTIQGTSFIKTFGRVKPSEVSFS